MIRRTWTINDDIRFEAVGDYVKIDDNWGFGIDQIDDVIEVLREIQRTAQIQETE